MLALGGLGYAGYRYYEKNRVDKNGVAFADGQPEGQFRDAGATATGTKGDTMSATDEALDETYPASDATASESASASARQVIASAMMMKTRVSAASSNQNMD